MDRLILLGLIVIPISCNDQNQLQQINKNQNHGLYKFYDFNLKVEIINPFKGIESRYLYVNSGMDYFDQSNDSVISRESFKSNTLCYIDVFENLNNNSKIKDTLKIQIDNSQIDTLYQLASELFKIGTKNISTDSISQPPKYTDGLAANVELDLGFRGNKYLTQLSFGSEHQDNNFTILYKYLLKLRNSH